jgi:hypothetical protein
MPRSTQQTFAPWLLVRRNDSSLGAIVGFHNPAEFESIPVTHIPDNDISELQHSLPLGNLRCFPMLPLWCAKTKRKLAKGRKASVFSDSCPEFDRCLSRSNPDAHSVESRCYAASKISHCDPLQFRF